MAGKRKKPTAAQLAVVDLLIEEDLSMRPGLAAAPELVESLLAPKRRPRARKRTKRPSAGTARKAPGKRKSRKAAGKK
jgi:hypothetical protein